MYKTCFQMAMELLLQLLVDDVGVAHGPELTGPCEVMSDQLVNREIGLLL